MGKTIYTVKTSLPIYGVYRCSKCGEYVLFENNVSVKNVASKRGMQLEKTQDAIFDDLSKESQLPLVHKVFKTIEESKKRNFLIHEFKCKCKNCGHIELWSKFRYSLFDKIAGMLLKMSVVFVLLIVLSIILQEWSTVIILVEPVLLCIFMYLIWKLFKKYDISKKEHKMANLSQENFPMLFTEQSDAIEYAIQNHYIINGYTDLKTLQNKENEKNRLENGEVCEVCGAMLEIGQLICHVCGKNTST